MLYEVSVRPQVSKRWDQNSRASLHSLRRIMSVDGRIQRQATGATGATGATDTPPRGFSRGTPQVQRAQLGPRAIESQAVAGRCKTLGAVSPSGLVLVLVLVLERHFWPGTWERETRLLLACSPGGGSPCQRLEARSFFSRSATRAACYRRRCPCRCPKSQELMGVGMGMGMGMMGCQRGMSLCTNPVPSQPLACLDFQMSTPIGLPL